LLDFGLVLFDADFELAALSSSSSKPSNLPRSRSLNETDDLERGRVTPDNGGLEREASPELAEEEDEEVGPEEEPAPPDAGLSPDFAGFVAGGAPESDDRDDINCSCSRGPYGCVRFVD
jgi:hypothetical protein